MNEKNVINKPNCYECKHRGTIPGDCHSCCKYPGTKTGMFSLLTNENSVIAMKLNIKGDPVGIKKGWFMWPINFDPAWLRNCDGFEKK